MILKGILPASHATVRGLPMHPHAPRGRWSPHAVPVPPVVRVFPVAPGPRGADHHAPGEPRRMSAQPARLHRPDDSPAPSPGAGPQASGRRLGRGLNALLGSQREEPAVPAAADGAASEGGSISVELIARNPFQPRQDFAEAELKELAESITRHGVLQPLLVREVDGEYQLIAGERRLMAAKRAGLETVPCRVMQLEDRAVCEAAIEENIKRKDLHALEKARAFRDYLDRFGGTVEALAKSLSVSRPAVSNLLRLLDLEAAVSAALRADTITAGHARALLALSGADQVAAMELVVDGGMTVRAAEKLCRDLAFERDAATAAADAEAAGLTAPVYADDTAPAPEETAAEGAANAADGEAPAVAGVITPRTGRRDGTGRRRSRGRRAGRRGARPEGLRRRRRRRARRHPRRRARRAEAGRQGPHPRTWKASGTACGTTSAAPSRSS